jgi:TonB family protein
MGGWRSVLVGGGAVALAVILGVGAAGCAGKTSVKAGGAAAAGFWSGETDLSWYDDEKGEFTINTAEELAGIAELVNEGVENFEGKTIRLGRDIMINDTANWLNWAKNPPAHSWIGIGTDKERFVGTFDGGGHTISGVYIKNPKDDQGLFGVTGHGGTVKRLNVIASYVEGKDYAGILAGGSAGLITECYTFGIVVGDSIVGGLTGVNDGVIKSSYAAGSVKGRIHVGGFMGANRGGAVIGNHSSVSVVGDTVVGGFTGANWVGIISGNFSVGKVTGRVDVGGFAGRNYNSAMLRSNYYDKKTSGRRDSGKGEGKTTAKMRSEEIVDNLNFIASLSSANAWVHSPKKYPTLSNKPAAAIDISGFFFFAGGKGTKDDPYIINSKEELENFSMLVSMGMSFLGKYLKLGQDIVLNNTASWQNWANEPPAYHWVPIGLHDSMFEGTFDGGGHTISGIYIDVECQCQGGGLFGFTGENATIKNVGVIASYFKDSGVSGGLVGYNTGKIINSYTAVIIETENDVAGGLVGGNLGGSIVGCYSTSTVSGGEYVGGLVGISGESEIRNSYSAGTVKGTNHVGGLVGINGQTAIINSYSVSTVMENGEHVGPLVGKRVCQCHGRVSNSYYDSEMSGVANNNIGTSRTTKQMQQKGTFVGWDFKKVWGINNAINNGYPYLLETLHKSTIVAADKPNVNANWYSASASEFTISTADELAAFAEIVNGTWGGKPEKDNFAGKTVRLAKNIDLSEYDNWVPIGSFDGDEDDYDEGDFNLFSGTFDGGGFVISNLTINRPNASLVQGLFGGIENATIKNLGLENVNIRGDNAIGALVAGVTNNSSIINCYSTGTIKGNENVGGLVGVVSGNSFVVDSYSAASVSDYYSDYYSDDDCEDDCDDVNDELGGVVGFLTDYSMVINSYSTSAGNVSVVGNISRNSSVRDSTTRDSSTVVTDTGGNQLSGRMKKRLSDLPEGATLTGQRSRASIQRVIVLKHRAALRYIHEWRQERKPEVSGTVSVRFTIDEFGKVTSAKLESSSVNDSTLANAVILRVKHIDFGPINKPGDVTEVVYPFFFAPASEDDTESDSNIPTTLEECYIALDNLLSEDTKDDIASLTRGEFLSSAHFGLGMWIRNNWIYPSGSGLATLFGGRDGDSISSVILHGYYNHLNGIEENADD